MAGKTAIILGDSAPAAAQRGGVPSAPAGEPRWQVRLLGAVDAFDGVQRVERFPSRAVAALLARLALAPERAHAREELVELLWPGVALAVGRNRLRQVLSTLKSLLEPAGVPGAAVLLADRLSLRVVRGALGCDALDFERHARAGRAAQAQALYRGELMPGYYDEWIDDERRRLAALHGRLLDQPGAAPGAAVVAVESSAVADIAHTAAPAAPAAPPLPTYLTRLFGADMAAARLRGLVLGNRLVSLLGPGGSGKTRLAVAVAQALREEPGWRPDEEPGWWPEAGAAGQGFTRIAFVPLAACDSAAQTVGAMARALLLGPRGDGLDGGAAAPDAAAAEGAADGIAGLAAALAGQRVLLVLDNFEQLLGRAEAAVAELLSRLPGLHVLVTSRRALGLDGERCIAAEPLALPAVDTTLAAAAANPAVALFVDRARAVRADFHLSQRNYAAIAALMRALHGLPLAIELAATRVRSFAPAEMVALLTPGGVNNAGASPHLALLARGGPRAGHDLRQASMERVIEWSWRQLEEPAQRMLGALTVFPADTGASAAAAGAVLGPGTAPAAQAALWLDDLVAHSLLRAEPAADGSARFSLLEPVREFAAARLAAAEAGALRGRLRQWLIDWAHGLGAAPSPARVAPELAAVHAAFSSAAADGAPRQALELALALRSYWDTDGLPGTSLRALEQALALWPAAANAQAADIALRADMHELLAYLRFEAGFAADATVHAEAALLLAGAEPSRRARALVRRVWIDIAGGRGYDPVASHTEHLQPLLQEALALARACGDREAQARALHQLAVFASHRWGDHAGAETLLEESQALWLALGDRRKAYARLRNRAQCWLGMGRRAEAMASFELCEQAAREDGDWVGQMDSLLSLAVAHAHRREWQAAVHDGQRGVRVCWQRWHKHGLAYALWNLPRPLARLGQPATAMRLMAFAATFWAARIAPLGAADLVYVRRVRGLVRAQLGAARAEALWLEGAAMDVAAAVALALA